MQHSTEWNGTMINPFIGRHIQHYNIPFPYKQNYSIHTTSRNEEQTSIIWVLKLKYGILNNSHISNSHHTLHNVWDGIDNFDWVIMINENEPNIRDANDALKCDIFSVLFALFLIEWILYVEKWSENWNVKDTSKVFRKTKYFEQMKFLMLPLCTLPQLKSSSQLKKLVIQLKLVIKNSLLITVHDIFSSDVVSFSVKNLFHTKWCTQHKAK